MDAMNAFLVTEQFDRVWAVLGNPSTGQHMLVDADRGLPLSEADNLRMRLGGLEFAGIFGYRAKDNYANAHAEAGPGCALVMVRAFPTFMTRLSEHLGAKRDTGDWLEQLWKLQDKRSA